jgi:hypothetical protein
MLIGRVPIEDFRVEGAAQPAQHRLMFLMARVAQDFLVPSAPPYFRSSWKSREPAHACQHTLQFPSLSTGGLVFHMSGRLTRYLNLVLDDCLGSKDIGKPLLGGS